MAILPTDRVCNVMVLARHLANKRDASQINTEDILIAICQEGSGVAAYALRKLNVVTTDRKNVLWEIEEGRSEFAALAGEARAMAQRSEQHALQFLKEQSKLPFAYIGTETILLAMVDGKTESGTLLLKQMLEDAGHTLEVVPEMISSILRPPKS